MVVDGRGNAYIGNLGFSAASMAGDAPPTGQVLTVAAAAPGVGWP
jgi:hypothetical protein